MSEKKMPKKPKVVFAPGAFDNFEGTQEELDNLVKSIEEMVSNGTFLENSVPLDSLGDEIIELIEEELDLQYKGRQQKVLH